jgi:hypothetical protein
MLFCMMVSRDACNISVQLDQANEVSRSDGKTGSEAGRREKPTVRAHSVDTLHQFETGRDGVLQVFSDNPLTSSSSSVNVTPRPEKKIQLQIFAKMKAIDSERAVTAMAAWARFVDLASRTRTKPFETLEQYLPSRAIDAGEL